MMLHCVVGNELHLAMSTFIHSVDLWTGSILDACLLMASTVCSAMRCGRAGRQPVAGGHFGSEESGHKSGRQGWLGDGRHGWKLLDVGDR